MTRGSAPFLFCLAERTFRAIRTELRIMAIPFQGTTGRSPRKTPYISQRIIPTMNNRGMNRDTSLMLPLRYPLMTCGTKPEVVTGPARSPMTARRSTNVQRRASY